MSFCDREKVRKNANKGTGLNKGEKSSYIKGPDGLRKEDTKPSTTMSKENVKKTRGEAPTNGESSLKEAQQVYIINKRPMKKSRKRCHFCRKRGHIQKDCLSKQMLRKWLWDDASEKVEEHPAEMQSVAVTQHER